MRGRLCMVSRLNQVLVRPVTVRCAHVDAAQQEMFIHQLRRIHNLTPPTFIPVSRQLSMNMDFSLADWQLHLTDSSNHFHIKSTVLSYAYSQKGQTNFWTRFEKAAEENSIFFCWLAGSKPSTLFSKTRHLISSCTFQEFSPLKRARLLYLWFDRTRWSQLSWFILTWL